MNRILIVLLVFAFQLSIFAQDEPTGSFGVFDHFIDRGTDEFPPKVGQYKVPGRVEITEVEGELVYDIYGNGNNAGGVEEFFGIYSEKSGSWRLSAHMQWIDRGGDGAWPLVRIGASDQSENNGYFILFHNRIGQPPGDIFDVVWNVNGVSNNVWALESDKNLHVPHPENGVFLRLTRIAPVQQVFSEWSEDGENWNLIHQRTLALESVLNYSIIIKNDVDNELLAHARVSHVTLEPVRVFGARYFLSRYYKPDQPFHVLIRINNQQEIPANTVVRETIPDGWLVSEMSHNGSIHDNTSERVGGDAWGDDSS